MVLLVKGQLLPRPPTNSHPGVEMHTAPCLLTDVSGRLVFTKDTKMFLIPLSIVERSRCAVEHSCWCLVSADTLLYPTVFYLIVACNIVPCNIAPCSIVPYHTISWFTMLHSAIPYHAIFCCAMPCCPVWYHTVLYGLSGGGGVCRCVVLSFCDALPQRRLAYRTRSHAMLYLTVWCLAIPLYRAVPYGSVSYCCTTPHHVKPL